MASNVAPVPSRTLMDFPPPGSRRAPKTFSGKYFEIESFLQEFDSLAMYYSLTNDEKFRQITRYVTRSVRDIIEGLSAYRDKKWNDFKDALMMLFEHERTQDRYTIRDLKSLVDEWRNRRIDSLRDF